MSNLAIAFNTNGITTANVILVLREKSDLSTIVYQQAFTANSQHNVTVTDLNPVMHQVEIWDTPDGTTLNALKGQCDMDAAQSSGSGSFGYIQFKVGTGSVVAVGTPTAGTCPVDNDTQYVDTALDGLNYLVSKGGYGILQWGVEIQAIAGGGFEYIDGQKFSDQDEYTVIVANSNSAPTITTSASEITDIVLHTTDDTLASGDRNKLHIFNYAGTTGVLTMETLIGVPNKTLWVFSTHQGSQINGEIIFQSGQGCYVNGVLKNRIFLGKNETLKMMVKTSICYALEYASSTNDLVGTRIMADRNDGPNTLPLNSPTTEYDSLIYKRAWDYITNKLASGQKCTYTEYDLTVSDNDVLQYFNRGKIAVNLVSGKFKLPDMRDNYPKAVAAGRESGAYQGWRVGSHLHQSGTEANPITKFLKGVSQAVRAWAGGASTAPQAASTDLNAAAGVTNEVKNIGYFPCIII